KRWCSALIDRVDGLSLDNAPSDPCGMTSQGSFISGPETSVPREPLPIDPVLPELLDALRRQPCAVLRAPTGAGKTTRVPPALLDAGLAGAGRVLVLEPRRLAARAAARRMADEHGSRLGDVFGY